MPGSDSSRDAVTLCEPETGNLSGQKDYKEVPPPGREVRNSAPSEWTLLLADTGRRLGECSPGWEKAPTCVPWPCACVQGQAVQVTRAKQPDTLFQGACAHLGQDSRGQTGWQGALKRLAVGGRGWNVKTPGKASFKGSHSPVLPDLFELLAPRSLSAWGDPGEL